MSKLIASSNRSRTGISLLRRISCAFIHFPPNLYAGDDHFLLIHNAHFTENYRRFYFNEIEGLIARHTTRRRNFNLVLGGLLLFFVFIAMCFRNEEALVMIAIFAFFPLLLLVINFALGPTIECKIRTSASEEIITPINRLRSYRKFLNQVRAIVEERQGGRLEPEYLYAHFRSPDPSTEGMV